MFFNETISYSIIPGQNAITYCVPTFFSNYTLIEYAISCNGPGCVDCGGMNGTLAYAVKPIKNGVKQYQVNLSTDSLETRNKVQPIEFKFYPNPFSKGINMEFTAPQSDVMKMEVYNQVGIQVFTKTIDLMQGINLRYIDEFENMPSGVYTVKLKGTQSEHNTRVIKIE